MTKKVPLSDELKQDLKALEDKAEALTKTQYNSDLWISDEAVRDIQEEMEKPDWRGTIEHELIQNDGTRLAVRMKASFELHMATMIKEHSKTRQNQVDGLVEALESQGGGSEEIKEIVSEALLPRTTGLTRQIQVTEGKMISDMSEYQELPQDLVGVLELYVHKELVRFDYSDLLEAVVQERLIVDREQMSKHIWMPIADFTKNRKISETFSWKDGRVHHMAKLGLEKK